MLSGDLDHRLEAAADQFQVAHDRPLIAATGSLLRNDYDLDGDDLTALLDSDVSHGTLALNSNGSFSYVPQAGYVGRDSFRYYASDGTSDSGPVSVTIDVTNQQPISSGGYHRIDHDTVLSMEASSGLIDDARDADDDSLDVLVLANVQHGTLTVAADGSYSYAPNARFRGVDSFVYAVTDGVSSSAPSSVRIEVVNTAPAITGDLFATNSGQLLSVAAPGILRNDVDFEHDVLTLNLVSTTSHGSLALNSDGAFTYSPIQSFVGTDSAVYEVTDGIDHRFGTIVLRVEGSSGTLSAPEAKDDFFRVTHGSHLEVTFAQGVLANDAAVHAGWLDAELVTFPAHGAVTLHDDGSFDYATSDPSFTGQDSFTYKARDGQLKSQPATVHLHVDNAPPSAAPTAFQTHQGTRLLAGQASLRDFGADGDGDGLTFSVITGAAHGTLSVSSDGVVQYTPSDGFVGNDSFTYRVFDGVSYSEPAPAIVAVTNTAPFAVDRRFSTQHGHDLTDMSGGVLATAGDADNDTLTIALVTGPTHGGLSLAPTGAFTYSPTSTFAGRDQFTFRVFDGAEYSATMTATMDVLNLESVGADARYSVHQGTALVRSLSAWDGDGDTPEFQIARAPEHGVVSLDGDEFTYTPASGFVGADNFAFTVADGIAVSPASRITINVSNAAPIALDKHFTVRPFMQTVGSLAPGLLALAKDVDGDPLSLSSNSSTTGSHTLSHGDLVVNADGSWNYQPNGTSSGTDTFTYQVTDGAENSSVGTITVEVLNQAPLAPDRRFHKRLTDANVSGVNRSFAFNLMSPSGVVFDPDGDPVTASLFAAAKIGSVTLASNGEGVLTVPSDYVGIVSFQYQTQDPIAASEVGTVTFEIGNMAPHVEDDYFSLLAGETLNILSSDLVKNDFDLDGDQLTLVDVTFPSGQGSFSIVSPSAIYSYDPGAFSGSVSFRYKINDGAETSEFATVHIEVISTPPWAIGKSYQVPAGQAVHDETLLGPDSAWDLEGLSGLGVHAISVAGIPVQSHGTLNYQATEDAQGLFKITDGFHENDANGASDNNVTLDVDVVWDPTLYPYNGAIRQPYKFIDCGSGGAEGGDPTAAMLVQTQYPAHPQACAANNVSLTNQAPSVVADLFRVLHDQTLTGNVLANDLDADGDQLSVTSANAVHGAITLNPNGDFTYVPQTHYVGLDTVEYTVTDGLDSRTGVSQISVHNDAPLAFREPVHRKFIQRYDKTAAGNLLANDFDADGDALVVSAIKGIPLSDLARNCTSFENPPDCTRLEWGSLFFGADGTFRFVPDGGEDDPSPLNVTTHQTGEVTFSYTISDGVDSDTTDVKLEFYNNVPKIEQETFNIEAPPQGILEFIFSVPTEDADGEPLTIELGEFAGGTVDSSGSGQLTLTFDEPVTSGTFQLAYAVSDPFVATAAGTFTVNVFPQTATEPGGAGGTAGGPGPTGGVGTVTQYWAGGGNTLILGDPAITPVARIVHPRGSFGMLSVCDNRFIYDLDDGLDESFARQTERFAFEYTDGLGRTQTGHVLVKPFVLEPGLTVLESDTICPSTTPTAGLGGGRLGSASISVPGSPRAATNNGDDPVRVWFGTSINLRGDEVPNGANTWISTFGDADWAGLTNKLRLDVTGSLTSQVDIPGDLTLYVTKDAAENIRARDVTMDIIEDIGNVVATDEILSVRAGTGHIESTVSQNDTHLLMVAYAPGGGVGSIRSLRGNISGVYVYGDIGPVVAAGTIGFVWTSRDLVGDISAGVDIGAYQSSLDALTINQPGVELYSDQRGIFAGRDVLKSVQAGHDITVVRAERNVLGPIHAGHDLFRVRAAGGDIAASAFVAADRDVGQVSAGHNVAGNVSGKRNVGGVTADNDILGNVTAGHDISGVDGGRDIRGDIAAEHGSITAVLAGNSNSDGGTIQSGRIYATGVIGTITAQVPELGSRGDIIVSTISADSGSIGSITAGRTLTAEMEARTSIGRVEAGTTHAGDLSGSVTSRETFVETIRDTRGSIIANVSAQTRIMEVRASANITGDLQADEVRIVTAQSGSIVGTIHGRSAIGNVTAGRDVAATITAGAVTSGGSVVPGRGNLGRVIAGNDSYGDITATIDAGHNIDGVKAKGQVSGDWNPFDMRVQSAYQASLRAWLDSSHPDPDTYPIPPRINPIPQSSAGGNIASHVHAGGSIGGVVADRDIEQEITAHQEVRLVAARHNVQGNVQSGRGQTTVSAGRELAGNVTTSGNAFTYSYDKTSGTVTSHHGAAVLNSWANIEGRVIGELGAFVYAYGDITVAATGGNGGNAPASSSLSIGSSQGPAIAAAFGKIDGQLTAAKTAAVGAFGKFNGGVISHNGSSFVNAIRGVNGQIEAHDSAVVTSLKDIEGRIIANDAAVLTPESLKADMTAEKSIRAYVRNDVQAALRSTAGDIYINAKNVAGNVTADQGFVGIDAFADLSATVAGGKGVSALVLGKSSGDITSSQGQILLMATGDITGNLTANGASGGIALVSWGKVAGELNADQGPVNVAFAYGNVSNNVHAGQDANLFAWGNVSGEVTAGGMIDIFARHDVTKDVTAQKNARVLAGGNVAGDVKAGGGSAQAGYDVTVIAVGDISGNLEASRNATADSLGSVRGVVTGHAGNASISALGDYYGLITAGANATVSVGALLSSTTISAGQDVVAAAHAVISDLKVTAGRDVTVTSDEDVSDTVIKAGLTNNGVALVGALMGICNLDVQGGLDAHVVSGGAGSQVKAKAIQRDAEVLAFGNLTGEFTGGQNVSATSFGELTSATATAQNGSASVFGRLKLSATVSAHEQLTATSMYDVHGTYGSAGSATIVAGESFGGTATAVGAIQVSAGDQVYGSVASSQGDASVGSIGVAGSSGTGVTATVSAHRDATVTALLGSVTGKVNSTQGNVYVTSGDQVNGAINSGAHAEVFAVNGITGNVTARGNALIVTYAAITGNITTTKGHVSAVAGKDVSGEVDAHLNAYVKSHTGQVTGDVTSRAGSVEVVALTGVPAKVTADISALVASLANVSGNVEATLGDATVVARGGDVSGAITAGRFAGVFSLGGMSGTVTAGGSALVVTLGPASGTVDAGVDGLIVSGDAVSGNVTAYRHAAIVAFGLVSGSVTGVTGDAGVITWGGVATTVTAGRDGGVLAGGGGTATVNARDAYVGSFGDLIAWVQATRDGLAWSAMGLGGAVDAGRDGGAVALGSSTALVAAGQDAFVVTFGDYLGGVTGGRDAVVLSSGMAMGSVTGGRDAGNFSFEGSGGAVTAGRYAVVETWGDAFGPLTVSGPEGAFAWSYGDCECFVTSSDGPAAMIALGTGVGSVDGATDAFAFTVGDFVGDVTAGDMAGAIVLGSFSGNVTAGSDGFVLSEGSVGGGITAGRDAGVWAIGSVSGDYVAARDAVVVTYGSFNADLSASRDVLGVWARGDLSGTIAAGRNIGDGLVDRLGNGDEHSFSDGDVFSFGAISAAISAGGDPNLPDGGQIGTVAAWGGIDGSITASQAIQLVRSGHAIGATITAPSIGDIVENDATIFQRQYPQTPQSVAADILADAALVRAQLVDLRALTAAQIVQLLDDFADAKAVEAAKLAAIRQTITDSNAAVEARAVQSLAIEKASMVSQLASLRQYLSAEIEAARSAAAEDLAHLQTLRDQIRGMQQAAYDHAIAAKNNILGVFSTADADLAQAHLDAAANAVTALQTRDMQWVQITLLLAQSPLWGWRHEPPPPPAQPFNIYGDPNDPSSWQTTGFYFFSVWRQLVWNGVNENPVDPLDRALNIGTTIGRGLVVIGVGGLVVVYAAPALASALGLKGTVCTVIGTALSVGGAIKSASDYWNIYHNWDKMQAFEQDQAIGGGIVDFVSLGFGRLMKFLQCFTAETEVQRAPESGAMWYASAGGVFLATVGGMLVTHQRRRLKPEDEEAVDTCLAGESPDDDWNDRELPMLPHEPESFDQLCDWLFHGSAEESWWNPARVSGPSRSSSTALRQPTSGLEPSSNGRQRNSLATSKSLQRGRTATAAVTNETSCVVTKGAHATSPLAAPASAHRAIKKRFGWRGTAAIVAGCLLAACCAVRGWRIAHETSRPIAQIQVGQKVRTEAPREAMEAAEHDLGQAVHGPIDLVDPATWKLVRMRAEVRWDDGTLDDVNVETLQPPDWLADNNVRVGREIPVPLDLVEMGLPADVRARVLAIEPCPKIEPAPGRIVLTTVNHLNADVHELTIRDKAGQEETIRTTGGHKFYSATRNEWLSAAELQRGETLDGLQGQIVVVALTRLPGTHRVYNMTVQGEHVYRVAGSGVLVHNMGCLRLFDTLVVDGIRGVRIHQGSGNTIAVIGRDFGAVKKYADGIKQNGFKVELFQPSQALLDEFEQIAKGGRLSTNAVRGTSLYRANREWAAEIARKGLTVIDIGNPLGKGELSSFYEIEKFLLFFGAN